MEQWTNTRLFAPLPEFRQYLSGADGVLTLNMRPVALTWPYVRAWRMNSDYSDCIASEKISLNRFGHHSPLNCRKYWNPLTMSESQSDILSDFSTLIPLTARTQGDGGRISSVTPAVSQNCFFQGCPANLIQSAFRACNLIFVHEGPLKAWSFSVPLKHTCATVHSQTVPVINASETQLRVWDYCFSLSELLELRQALIFSSRASQL